MPDSDDPFRGQEESCQPERTLAFAQVTEPSQKHQFIRSRWRGPTRPRLLTSAGQANPSSPTRSCMECHKTSKQRHVPPLLQAPCARESDGRCTVGRRRPGIFLHHLDAAVCSQIGMKATESARNTDYVGMYQVTGQGCTPRSWEPSFTRFDSGRGPWAAHGRPNSRTSGPNVPAVQPAHRRNARRLGCCPVALVRRPFPSCRPVLQETTKAVIAHYPSQGPAPLLTRSLPLRSNVSTLLTSWEEEPRGTLSLDA